VGNVGEESNTHHWKRPPAEIAELWKMMLSGAPQFYMREKTQI